MIGIKVLCLLASVGLAVGVSLPSYIETCKKDDPKIGECAVKKANAALPSILKGDKSLKLDNLLPYHLPKISISSGDNLKLDFNDCVLHGLDTLKLTGANIDFDKKRIQFLCFADRIELDAIYKIDGHILILPISGSGPSNITLVNVKVEYNLDYELEKHDDGKEYLKSKASELLIDSEKTYYELQKLFNGDERLGAEMNKFLNENQKEVSKEFFPAITEVVKTITDNILLRVIHKTPFAEIFS